MTTTVKNDYAEGDRVSGFLHVCPMCGVKFIARADALYCSGACRVAATRARAEK